MTVRKSLSVVLALLAPGCLNDPTAAGNLVPKTVMEDPELPALEIGGTQLHLETHGDPTKPVMVFLHGGPGADYRSLLRLRGTEGQKRLEDDYFLVFYDQRGTGLSERLDLDQTSIDRLVQDLDEIVDRFSPGRPIILVGHSWGGMLGTAYIEKHPDRVANVVFLECGPLTGALYEEHKQDINGIDVFSEWANDYVWDQRFLSAEDHAEIDYAAMVARGLSQPRFHESKTDPEPVWRLGMVSSRALFQDGSTNGVATYDLASTAKNYTGPVLLVASERNEVLGIQLQELQSQFFANPTVTVVEGAGHDFPWTNPDQTIAIIRNALEVKP